MKKLNHTLVGRKGTTLLNKLNKSVIGQSESLNSIVEVYQTYLAGMQEPKRPIGNFLFLGPTGVGKTYTVEMLAEIICGKAEAVLKVDCAEFQHSHEIAKLVGSPPGYLGHLETTALLCSARLNQYTTKKNKVSFVLFDEIEKASDALWNLLLGILDKGILTLGNNEVVDFSNTMIFMTSNLGVTEVNKTFSGKASMGFSHKEYSPSKGTKDDIIKAAMIKNFSPEFINRIDKISIYDSLGKEEIAKILDLELDKIRDRVLAGHYMDFTFSNEAKLWISNKGVDYKYGARYLKRCLQVNVVNSVCNLINSCQATEGNTIVVDYIEGDDGLTFSLDESRPLQSLTEDGFVDGSDLFIGPSSEQEVKSLREMIDMIED